MSNEIASQTSPERSTKGCFPSGLKALDAKKAFSSGG
jgi:hypothetical protein